MRIARRLVVVLALSSAVGAATLVHRVARTPLDPARAAAADVVEIMVAARAIAVGETVGKDQVRWQPWPRGALPGGSLRRAAGAAPGALPFEPAPARFAMLEGEPLSAGKLVRAEDGSALAALVAPGMRAVSVPIRDETSAGGFIQPSDRVDVIVTPRRTDGGRESPRSEILLRGARVLAMGRALNGKANASKTATLELTPSQARTLSAAQSAGEVSLALIGTVDLAQGGFPIVSPGEPAKDIRILKYGRSANRQMVQ